MKEIKFKDTEIGRIPEDWEVCKLSNRAMLVNGRAYKQEELLNEGQYKVLRVGNFFTNDSWYYSDLELPEKMFCNKGDLLYAWSCTYGAYIWTEDKTIFHYHIWKVIPDGNTDKYFLRYILNFDVEQQRKSSQGSTMSHITKGFLEERLFVFPPINEQLRIASALTCIDNLISSLDKLIEKKKNIKQGAMLQLLTGKKRLKGFNEPWVEYTIKDICAVKRGVRIVKSQLDNLEKFPVYQNTNIPLGFFSNYNVDEFTPFVIIGGSAGQIGICNTKYWAADDCAYFECSDVILKNFLYLMLIHNQSIILQNVRTSTVPRLDRAVLQKLKIRIPSNINEQRAIVSLLSSMDKDISSLESKKSKYERIKQGMMQQLLTGKIRLTDTLHHAKEYSAPVNDNYSFAAEPLETK